MPPTTLSQALPPVTTLGEELPVFCEKCGYSLHGATQVRCEQCDILQFHCPECGHHQPINTLRPALQRMLGRARAVNLVAWIIIKLFFFALTLLGWGNLAGEDVHQIRYERERENVQQIQQSRGHPIPESERLHLFDDMFWPVAILGFLFAAAGRMLLLRWRWGWAIGLILAGLVEGSMLLGAHVASITYSPRINYWTGDWCLVMAWTGFIVAASATCVWGLWVIAVWLLLPRRIGDALLQWQRSLSRPRTSPDTPVLFK